MLSLVIAAAMRVAASDEIASVMRSGDDATFWIAAEQAVGPDGKLNQGAMGRLGSGPADHLARRNGRRNDGAARQREGEWPELAGCESFYGSVPENVKPNGSLRDLTKYAEAIVVARVVAMRQGFLGGLPGSLLLLEAEYLKGTPAPAIYLFYPLARIATADGLICGVPVGPFVPPSVGDRVLVFSMTAGQQLDRGTVFHVRIARELVHEPRKGTLQLPPALTRLTSPANRRFDEVLAAVRSALAAPCGEAAR